MQLEIIVIMVCSFACLLPVVTHLPGGGWNIFYPGRGEDIYDNFSNDYNLLFSKAFH